MEQPPFQPENGTTLATEIQILFEEDQKDREDGLLQRDSELLRARDAARYERANKLFEQYRQTPESFSGEMKFNLALLFQHGTNSEDYKKAFELAQAAERDDFDGAETLVKAAEDRYLLSLGQPQKWGTQSIETVPEIQWVRPSLEPEMGEILRVAEKFSNTSEHESAITEKLKNGIQNGVLVGLADDLWSKLENTDSWKIGMGNFALVRSFAEEYGRDDQKLLEAMRQGKSMEAPVILQFGDTLHLVSGNTRLMLAKALGKTPKVIIVHIDETPVA